MGYERVCQRLLEYGVLAPSIYNSQPWKFGVDGKRGVIEVTADMERSRPLEIDRQQRDLYGALGACIENMVLAAPSLGYEVEVTFFPQNGVVAHLKLKPMPEAVPEGLFSSLFSQQTHAGLYQKNSVDEMHLERLRHIPAFSNAEKIYFLSLKDVPAKFTTFLHDVSHEGALKQDLIEEGSRWIRTQVESKDGLSIEHLGLPLSVRVRFAFLRYFFRAREIKEVSRQALLRQGHQIDAPAFMLMTTEKTDPEGYGRAGRWYTRLLLTLSEMELGAQTLYLPITLQTAHPQLLEFFKVTGKEEPLYLVRFGKPLDKKWPKPGRRLPSECSYLSSL